MTLKPLTLYDMQQIRLWRDEVRETLRTPYVLTAEQQEDYYRTVICDRDSRTRYWGLWATKYEALPPLLPHTQEGPIFIGYGGIENIEWENSTGEISILIGAEFHRHGYGRKAVDMFLEEAFYRLNLHSVHGECYRCSPACKFWQKIIQSHKGFTIDLPARKYWDDVYWPSMYFTFIKPAADWADGK